MPSAMNAKKVLRCKGLWTQHQDPQSLVCVANITLLVLVFASVQSIAAAHKEQDPPDISASGEGPHVKQ